MRSIESMNDTIDYLYRQAQSAGWSLRRDDSIMGFVASKFGGSSKNMKEIELHVGRQGLAQRLFVRKLTVEAATNVIDEAVTWIHG